MFGLPFVPMVDYNDNNMSEELNLNLNLPAWSVPFYQKRATYKSADGGRGSGKTWAFAQILPLLGFQKKLKIYCCRALEKELDLSALEAMKGRVYDLGLGWFYTQYSNRLIGRNGTEIRFIGLEKKRMSIRGWEEVDITWLEEAQYFSEKTLEILIPTVFRYENAEIWLTWNPDKRTDWVYKRFYGNPEPNDMIVHKVNWAQNRFFSEKNNEQRLRDYRRYPHRYAHIWEGFPDDAGGTDKFLPFAMLVDCLKAYEDGLAPRVEDAPICHVGLDIADAGEDLCAVVVRRGPVIEYVEAWPSTTPGYLSPTARKADGIAKRWNADALYYDGGGLGAPMREHLWNCLPSYAVRAENFGGAVMGKDAPYEPQKTNEMVFAKRNAQMGDALRLRAMRTVELMRGDTTVNPIDCLFINPACSDNLEYYMAELSQPLRRPNTKTGKIEIDKRGEENEKSPDTFDATAMAFSRDSMEGLKAF